MKGNLKGGIIKDRKEVMSVKNTRQKGRKLVKIILERIKREVDNGAYEVVGSGAGLDKGDIRIPSLDLVAEVKNCETISMAKWVKQAEREGLQHSKTALMWRHPKSPLDNPEIRVDIGLDYFIEIVQRYSEPRIKQPDREMRWKIQRLIDSAKAVLKELKE